MQSSHTLVRGDDIAFVLVVTERDPDTGEEARTSIQNYIIEVMAKRAVADDNEDAVIHVSTEPVPGGISIRDQGETEYLGEADVVIPSEQTTGLPDAVTYLNYDVQVTKPGSGHKVTIDRGRFAVEPDINRAEV